MKRLPVIILTIFQVYGCPVVCAQAGSYYTTATTYSNLFKDAFSFTGNTAALANTTSFSMGLHSQRRFLLQALSHYQMSLQLPTTSGNFGFNARYGGNTTFNQSAIGIAYAKSLGKYVDVGLQFNYFGMKAAGYGSEVGVNFDAGAIFHLTDAFNTGIYIRNPVSISLGKDSAEKHPSVYSAGFGYDVSPIFFIGAQIEKTDGQRLNVTGSFHYLLAGKVFARCGIASANSEYFFGLGMQIKQLRLDLTSAFHPYLGLTPGLVLIYTAGK